MLWLAGAGKETSFWEGTYAQIGVMDRRETALKLFWVLLFQQFTFSVLTGPCARSDWSKIHVLSEYKT